MTYLVCAINPDISYIFVPYPVLSQRMYCFVSRSDISAIQQRSTSLLIFQQTLGESLLYIIWMESDAFPSSIKSGALLRNK